MPPDRLIASGARETLVLFFADLPAVEATARRAARGRAPGAADATAADAEDASAAAVEHAGAKAEADHEMSCVRATAVTALRCTLQPGHVAAVNGTATAALSAAMLTALLGAPPPAGGR